MSSLEEGQAVLAGPSVRSLSSEAGDPTLHPAGTVAVVERTIDRVMAEGSKAEAPGPRFARPRQRSRLRGPSVRSAGTLVFACLVLVGCGDDGDTDVQRAEAKLEAAQGDLLDAEEAAEAATTAFCDQTRDYIVALDRYGDVLSSTKPTVGDVREAGTDLVEPGEDVVSGAEDAVAAREDVVAAEQDLMEAKAALAYGDGQVSGADTDQHRHGAGARGGACFGRPGAAGGADLDAALEGISDQTPLKNAAQHFNAAVVALEMSWLHLFSEVGCLTDEQQEQASSAVRDFTAALQQSLALAGHYTADVDGVYGPATVEAVLSLQEAHGLPATGAVDKATAAALQSDLAAQGGAAEQQSVATTAAVQQTLILAGYLDRAGRRRVDPRPHRSAEGVPDRPRGAADRHRRRRHDRRARTCDRASGRTRGHPLRHALRGRRGGRGCRAGPG